MAGDVDVVGQYNCLDVWNHDRFLNKLQREPYTDDDARALSEFGI
jgi:DNA-binding transcriptional regulator/RsmH inhibitor MraZ